MCAIWYIHAFSRSVELPCLFQHRSAMARLVQRFLAKNRQIVGCVEEPLCPRILAFDQENTLVCL